MFRDLANKAKLAAQTAQTLATAATAATTPTQRTKEGGGVSDEGGGQSTATPSSGIKGASREELLDLLRRSRSQNKQVQAKYISLSKKEKHFEHQCGIFADFIKGIVGVSVVADELIDLETLKHHWAHSNKNGDGEEDLLGINALSGHNSTSGATQKLQEELQSEKTERGKLLKKLREVVEKYKQLQKHARELKQQLEESEADADTTLNKAGEVGLHLLEEKKALLDDVERYKILAEQKGNEVFSLKKKTSSMEKVLNEQEIAKVQIEEQYKTLLESSQQQKENELKLQQTIEGLKNTLATAETVPADLSSSGTLDSEIKTLRTENALHKQNLIELQDSLEAANIDANTLISLRKENESLKQKNIQLVNKHEEVSVAFRELQDLSQKSKDEMPDSGNNDSPKSDLVSSENGRLKDRVEFLTKKGKELFTKHKNLQGKFEHLKLEYKQLQDVNEKLNSECQTVVQTKKEYEIRLERLTQAAAESQVDAGDKDEKLQALEEQLANVVPKEMYVEEVERLRTEITTLSKARDKAVEDLESAVSSHSEVGSEVASLKSMLESAKTEHASALAAATDEHKMDIKEKLTKAKAKFDEIKSTHGAEITSMQTSHEEEVERLRTEITTLSKARDKAVEDLESAMSSHSEVGSEVASLKSMLESAKTEHAARVEDLAKEHASALAAATDKHKTVLHEAQTSHGEEVERLKTEITTLSKARDKAVEDLESAVSSHSEVGSEVASLKSMLESAKTEHAARVEDLAKEHASALAAATDKHKTDIKEKLTKAKAKFDEIKSTHGAEITSMQTSHEEEVERLRTEITTLSKARDKAVEDLESAVSSHSEVGSEVASLQSMLESAKTEHAARVEDLAKEHASALAAATDKHKMDIKEKLTKAKAKFDEIKSTHGAEITSMQTSHEEEVERLRTEITTLSKARDKAVEDLESAVSSHSEVGSEVASLQSMLESAKTEHAARVEDLAKEHASALAAATDKHKIDIKEKLTKAKAKFDEIKSKHTAELESLKTLHATETSKVMEGLVSSNEQIEVMKAQLLEAENATSSSEEIWTSEKAGFEKSIVKLQSKHDDLLDRFTQLKQKSSFSVIEHQKEAAEYRQKVEDVEKRTRGQLEEMRKRMDDALAESAAKEIEHRAFRSETKKLETKHGEEMATLEKRFDSVKRALQTERESNLSVKADSELVQEWKTRVEEVELKLDDIKKTDKAIISEIKESAQRDIFNARQEAEEQTKIAMKALERLRQEEMRSDRFREETRAAKKKLIESESQVQMAKTQIQQLATFATRR